MGKISKNEDEISSKSAKTKKPGILYLSSIPSTMKVHTMRDYFSTYGEIGRLYLSPLERDKYKSKKNRKFREGWVEFASKRKAKSCYELLNNKPVGGKKKNPDHDVLWVMKYLPRFKWGYLLQRLEQEKEVRKAKMTTEIDQVVKDTDSYIAASEWNENQTKKKLKKNKDSSIPVTDNDIFSTKTKESQLEKDAKFKKLILIKQEKKKAKKSSTDKILKGSIFTGT